MKLSLPSTGLVVLALCMCAAAAGTTAPKDVDIRDLMTAQQLHQAGLDKLSADEVRALNVWLNDYLQQTVAGPALPPTAVVSSGAPVVASPQPVTPAAAASASASIPVIAAAPVPAAAPNPASALPPENFGRTMLSPEENGEPLSIQSTLPGRFSGWTGETVFRLANGQIWKQAGPGYYEVHLNDPVVVIKRLGLGYLLTLPGEGGTVFVRRLH